MKIEEYGKENASTIVMLHGANFVHCYGRQYPLQSRFHIVVPHIMGFGDEADRVFNTDACVAELASFVNGLDKKVLLVGFSLGAQLAFKLVSEYPDMFYSAILVSPWLYKTESSLTEAIEKNKKQLSLLKKKWLCNIIGIMNGLPTTQRKKFVDQMQEVKLKTICHSIDNGITFESVPAFATVSIPMMALAGEKEQQEVIDTVREMAGINPHCRYEVWEKAKHNIPPVFAKKFNQLIVDMAKSEVTC